MSARKSLALNWVVACRFDAERRTLVELGLDGDVLERHLDELLGGTRFTFDVGRTVGRMESEIRSLRVCIVGWNGGWCGWTSDLKVFQVGVLLKLGSLGGGESKRRKASLLSITTRQPSLARHLGVRTSLTLRHMSPNITLSLLFFHTVPAPPGRTYGVIRTLVRAVQSSTDVQTCTCYSTVYLFPISSLISLHVSQGQHGSMVSGRRAAADDKERLAKGRSSAPSPPHHGCLQVIKHLQSALDLW